jgi:hypothetical protein
LCLDCNDFADNVFAALLLLFELSTQENWPYFMYNTVDAPPVGHAPVRAPAVICCLQS